MSLDVPILDYRAQLHDELAASMVRPKFATKPDLSRPSIGRRQARFSKTWLHSPFMPHQHYISDVAGELEQDPESGLWVPAHTFVVVTIQRQAGKSHLVMARNGERCMTVPKFRAWYTAQTGTDARQQFLKFHDDVVDGTPLDAVVRTLRGAGAEQMKFPNDSWIKPYAPTDEALHGKQADGNDIDEGWAFSSERGKVLLQGSGPTELTRSSAQTGVWSAGGTAESTWLAELVARGRAGDPSICYVEFGIPDDLKIEGELTDDDYEAIASHHPAVGHTITMRALRKLRDKLPDDAEYARAAGNRWTEIIGGVIGGEAWKSIQHRDPIPESVPLGYGAARAADGSEVVVCAAADLGDLIVVEVLQVLPAFRAGAAVAAWAADGPLVVDRIGPSTALADDLKDHPRFLDSRTSDHAAAVSTLLDSIPHRAIRFRPHPALDDAVRVAATRPSGDGGQLWARTKAGASIAALEAATNALWAVTHRPAAESNPLIDFGGSNS